MGIARKCTYCGNLGHNSRTCNNINLTHFRQFKLFGVQLDVYSSSSPSYYAMKTSFSHGYLQSSTTTSLSLPSSPNSLLGAIENSDTYTSSTIQDTTRKGVKWTEEEHRIFLKGLEKLGKGNWRGISRSYVRTRTPSQVASHAQKHFLRPSHGKRRKHRPNMFLVGDESELDSGALVLPSKLTDQSGNRSILLSQWLSSTSSTNSINCTTVKSGAPDCDLELKLATPVPLELTVQSRFAFTGLLT